MLQFSKGYFHTLKILLYLYINIELIFDYRRIYFGTATLQQLQQRVQSQTAKNAHFIGKMDGADIKKEGVFLLSFSFGEVTLARENSIFFWFFV
jgi:hypothetical protein